MPIGRCQRGATLLELIIGIAVAGLVASASLIAVYGVLTWSRQANDTQLAISQVRAAEHWISRDALSAQSTSLGGTNGFPVTLAWTAIDGDDIQITYSLVDVPSSSLKQIRRDFTDSGGPNSTLIMCNYIDATASSCVSPSPKVLTFTLAATVRSYTETRSFDVKLRPETT